MEALVLFNDCLQEWEICYKKKGKKVAMAGCLFEEKTAGAPSVKNKIDKYIKQVD